MENRSTPTREAALAALHGLLRQRNKQGNPIAAEMQVYGCGCGNYHVGRTRGINWMRSRLQRHHASRRPPWGVKA